MRDLDCPHGHDVGILSFPHVMASSGVLSWREIEEYGLKLLFELQRLAEDETVLCTNRPFPGLNLTRTVTQLSNRSIRP